MVLCICSVNPTDGTHDTLGGMRGRSKAEAHYEEVLHSFTDRYTIILEQVNLAKCDFEKCPYHFF